MLNAEDLGWHAHAFAYTLADMSVEEILSRNGSDSPLAILMDAMLPSPQENGTLSNLWEMFRSAITGGRYGASRPDSAAGPIGARACRPTRNLPSRSVSAGADDLVSRRDRRIPAIIECVGIMADKIEQARLASMQRGRVTHAVFVSSVERFLQQEHICVCRRGDGSTEVHRSFTYMLCLQYLMPGNAEDRQNLMFELVKKFLIGFSRYALDARGARAIHYALSLCGGKYEGEFMAQIVRPLVAREARRFRTEHTSGSFFEALKDQEGNGPLLYALSSVYCSESAVRYALLYLDRISTSRDPAFLQEFLTGIPYYALFHSLSEDCERSKLAFMQSNAELRNSLGWLQGNVGSRDIDLHEVARIIRSRVENADGIAERARTFNTRFCNTFYMLCAQDARIRCNNALSRHEEFAPIKEFFVYCRQRLNRIRTESDMESCLLDDVIRGHLSDLFSFRENERNRIGARAVASELVEYVLSDNAYVRRVSICADYTRRLLRTDEAGNDANEWAYDTYTMVVNSFFAMVCSMCKLSSRFFLEHTEVCSGFLEAKHIYAREHRIFRAFCYFFPSVGSVILICVLPVIACSSKAPLHAKMWQMFGVVWAAVLICAALCTYCALEKAEIERRMLELERSSANYILSMIQCGENALRNAPSVQAAPAATGGPLHAAECTPSGEKITSVEAVTRDVRRGWSVV
ncbi:MAG: hypothetical protein AB8U69_01630 [Anaplasma ovis]|nr:hypothetical protein [Anaplasma ovis]ASI48304.1 hypothetical protein AOV_05040 [Anaplasma ovis str. Haibei]